MLRPPHVTRRAFPGFRFQGMIIHTGDNFSQVTLSWEDDRKEEIVKKGRNRPIIFTINMN